MAVKPIPDGYHSVTPDLVVEGADKLLEFVKNAFEALCGAPHKASNAQFPIMRSPPPPAPGSRGRRM
jgi:hypothetical protein